MFGQTTASVPVSGSSLNAMVFNYGGEILDADGKLSVDNQGFRDAFEMIQRLDTLGYNPQNAKLKDQKPFCSWTTGDVLRSELGI